MTSIFPNHLWFTIKETTYRHEKMQARWLPNLPLYLSFQRSEIVHHKINFFNEQTIQLPYLRGNLYHHLHQIQQTVKWPNRRQLKERIYEHLNNIHNNNSTGEHFIIHHHSEMKVQVIENISLNQRFSNFFLL